MKRTVIVFAVLFALYAPCRAVRDTTLTREELRNMASDAFLRSDYVAASVYYSKLLDYYPKDPGYNYRLGVCKTETGEDLQRAVELLGFASYGYVPPEVFYYLGLAYQRQGQFDKAKGSYEKYQQAGGRKDISRKELDQRLTECRNGERNLPGKTLQTQPPTETGKEKMFQKKDTIMPAPIEKKVVASYDNDRVPESGYTALLDQALKIQMTSDSLVRESDKRRSELLKQADWDSKKKLMAEINILQTEADNLQNDANAIYSRAREMELKFVSDSGQGKPMMQMKKPGNFDHKDAGSPMHNQPQVLRVQSRFEIKPQPAYSDTNPIPGDSVPNVGIVYKIQVGVFSKPVSAVQFRGLFPLSLEKIPGNGFVRYYAGMFTAILDAENALEKTRNYGFREAFIVSFYNGKKISLIRAREIEQLVPKK